jgi:hypothetical protein
MIASLERSLAEPRPRSPVPKPPKALVFVAREARDWRLPWQPIETRDWSFRDATTDGAAALKTEAEGKLRSRAAPSPDRLSHGADAQASVNVYRGADQSRYGNRGMSKRDQRDAWMEVLSPTT